MVNPRPALLADSGGTAAAEFALMLPMLLLMIFGTMQISLLMYSYNVMVTSARDTARAMAVCTITDTTGANLQAQASRPPWLSANDWQVQPTLPVGQGDVSLAITVSAAKAALINFLPVDFGNLSTVVTMRKEPLAFGSGSC